MSITVNDPLIVAALTQIDQSNPEFGSDVVNLINRSPLLVADIEQVDAQADVSGTQTVVVLEDNPGASGSSSYRSDVIQFSTLSTYQDNVAPYAGGSLTAAYDAVTPAATFVGVIGYEIGHVLDPTLGPLYVDNLWSHYSAEQALLTEFASEGTSGYLQAQEKAQIDETLASDPVPSDMISGKALFNVAGSYTKDTDDLRLLQTILDVGQAKSYLASQFWNVPANGGTFLSTYWDSYTAAGSINHLGIDEATVTGVTVQESAAGVLTGGTMTTTTNSYNFTFSEVGQETAAVTDLQGNLLYADAFSDVTGTIYGLSRTESNATFTTDPNAIETVTGNSNYLTDTVKSRSMATLTSSMPWRRPTGSRLLETTTTCFQLQTLPAAERLPDRIGQRACPRW